MENMLLLTQTASTLALVGLIWFVQVVHYPLFANVGRSEFADYERLHRHRTGFVAAPLMLLEAGTAIAMLWFRPAGVTTTMALLGFALVVFIWVSTFGWQVPAHNKLSGDFDTSTHRWLVRSNWLRTGLWTASGFLVCVIL